MSKGEDVSGGGGFDVEPAVLNAAPSWKLSGGKVDFDDERGFVSA